MLCPECCRAGEESSSSCLLPLSSQCSLVLLLKSGIQSILSRWQDLQMLCTTAIGSTEQPSPAEDYIVDTVDVLQAGGIKDCIVD